MNQDNVSPLADAYAALKHQEDMIKVRVSAVRDEILQTGQTHLVGEVAIVDVVEKKGAETLDKVAVLKLLESLGATPEQIASVVKVGKPSKALLVKANVALAI